ncbi:MAG: sulfotransferase domain-containing protein [Desulfobacterales bacterium]|nr:sulfotransferase domain-containing protein [Desulfobacterales bacterium]
MHQRPLSESIVLVSGLPRSGTSMMMRMLDAGGMPIYTDNIRKANEDNPNGYYELEKIKQLEQDAAWLKNEQGKVIKAISALLPSLPKDLFYHVIFMRRHMPEILASQQKMLKRRGVTDDRIPDTLMAAKYEAYLAATYKWIAKQSYLNVLYVHYNEVLADPWNQAQRVTAFLENRLNVENMVRVVDPDLYRQRKQA